MRSVFVLIPQQQFFDENRGSARGTMLEPGFIKKQARERACFSSV